MGWHEGGSGQLHAFLEQEGFTIDYFINDQPIPPQITTPPPPRPARRFSYPSADAFKSIPLVTHKDWISFLLDKGIHNVLLASPDNKRRKEMLEQAATRLCVLTYIHPTATILPEAIIEDGAIILARALIGYRAEIHAGAIVNTGVQVDHNSVVRTCAALLPGAILCGSVEVGPCATIGAGAIVINSIHIGKNSFVGAGALVRKHVPESTMVVGSPAAFHRKIED